MRSALFLLLVAACTDDAPTTESIGACDGKLVTEHVTSAVHVEVNSPISWTNNPPTAGNHFGVWAAWDRHYSALPRGYWVHNLEHGGIVLAYNCPDGCPDTINALVDVARNMAADPMCGGGITKRVIVTSDPLLPDGVQLAAVAWNHAYTASCYDPYVAKFAAQNYNKAPENLCSNGVDIGGAPLEP